MIGILELRIGNLVKCKVSNDAGIYSVIALDGVNLKVMMDGVRQGEWYMEDKIKPIKLTEEIITGMDLEKSGMGYYLFKEGAKKLSFRWVTQKFFEGEKLKTPFIRFDGLVDVYYVHHLQNIFHSLTGGKELLK